MILCEIIAVIRTIDRAVILAAAAWLVVLPGAAWSQPYPTKPIRMIVGFTPGGGTDTVARLIATKIADSFGQPVVIDNRPGAGGSIATEILAKSVPDGYSLIMVSGSHTINANLHRKARYDPVADFTPITQVARSQYLLTIKPSLAVGSVKELIALAKAKPGDLNYASAGNGSPPHLATELFKSLTGVDIVHVPFKGSLPLLTAILGGQIDLTFGNMGAVLPHVRAGKLKGLAVSASVRSPAAPEFPTVAEAGVPGFEATGWYGVLAPAGTSNQIVNKLHQEIALALKLEDVRGRLTAEGLEITATPPAQFAAYIKSENAKWAKVVKLLGMRVD